ncbi:MAG: SPOR domain-containing protein [Holosporaceae bacterium]|jgi:cell division septation protein DedD|nr:SPOR domain-containing protein [Holosporaceae bacterium]
MCPFIDDEDDYDYPLEEEWTPPAGNRLKSFFLQDDKKFFIVGGAAAVVALFLVVYVVYFGSKPVDLEDLPVIQADDTPFKTKPKVEDRVQHQDKTVYDNISGDRRPVTEKLAPPPEEILSIPDTDTSGGVMSEEEKKNIIQAFDDLSPEKDYKINYVAPSNGKRASTPGGKMGIHGMGIVEGEEEFAAPIKKIKGEAATAGGKLKRKPLPEVDEETASKEAEGTVMIQAATLPSKAAADLEYARILRKNDFLKDVKKKVFRVDLGEENGFKYALQIGPFRTKEEAKQVVEAMKNNGFSVYISK